ncbi:MAG TPA: hypothetical protein VGZ22_22945 [Isosphaeraceae bacterium]|jgi:hypothetical protein|nr:hypothetical protein [Isosphaeraceae bacterium]
MSLNSSKTQSQRATVLVVTALLGASVVVYLGYHLAIAFQPDDTNHLETPLAMAVARQIEEGPGVLYGPFNGQRPLVLIHSPLYYRLAALGAWPLAVVGFDPIMTAFAVGRVLAFLGLIATMAAAAWFARLDGAPLRAGLWSALLIAACPVIGSFPATVRPDTLGLALQTIGVTLVWRTLFRRVRETHQYSPEEEKIGAFHALYGATNTSSPALVLAYIAFGLAFCVKQHDVVAACVSSLFLFVAVMQRRCRVRTVIVAHAAALAIVIAYYGAEQLITGGRMAQSVFVLPAAFGRINHASWGHVLKVFVEVGKMAAGMILLAIACVWVSPKKALGSRLDAVVAVYLGAELAAMVALCLNSTGAWTNYAMQAVVFASILIGRALERVLAARPVLWRLAPVGLAAVAFLLVDVRLVKISAQNRIEDHDSLEAMFADPRVGAHAPEEIYFVGAPQNNRRFGRIDLAHDEWLYSSYEALAAAEPRSAWLRPALTEGTVRQVIVIGGTTHLRGLKDPLPRLGYRPIAQFGRYVVWERRESQRPAIATAASRASKRDER